MITLKGCHGTAKYHADNIRLKGFDCEHSRSRSLAGRGVYFWAYDSLPLMSELLAKNWWKYSLGRGWYDKGKDCGFSCIRAKICISSKENLLDLTELSNIELLASMRLRSEFEGLSDSLLLSAFVEQYTKSYENLYGLKPEIQVIKLNLNVPVTGLRLKIPFCKSYAAYVVRKNGLIHILDN